MAVINHNWYNKNELRKYPLIDGDTGPAIPNNILVDCNLWVPETAGVHVWVSSVTVTSGLVTITLQAADLPLTTFVPIASISLVKPIDIYRPYEVNALYPGVTGWVSFGNGVNTNYSALLTNSTSSEILPNKIQRYSGTVVNSIKKVNTQLELTGLVKLVAGGDISITAGVRDIDGLGARSVILVGLNDGSIPSAVHSPYISEQSARPENGNCAKQPFLFINDVPPDCAGNVVIEFPPEIIDTRHPTDNGIIIDYTLGFIEVCVASDPISSRAPKICDVPVDTDAVFIDIPDIPPQPPLPPDTPGGNAFIGTFCDDFSAQLSAFLPPKPQPPWLYSVKTITDAMYGVQHKPRMQLTVTLRNAVWRLIRDFTLGDHRNRLMQLEVQFGTSLFTSDPSGLGTWDNIGLIYNYVSQTSYNFVSLIWLGHNGPGVPFANDSRNAMLVIGHKTVNTKFLTPYGYDFQNPPVQTTRGLPDGHFIDTFKYIEIDPTQPYMLELTTVEGPAGTTTATAEVLEVDGAFNYVPLDSVVNVSATINVSSSSKIGLVSVFASDVFASFIAADPVACEPIILKQS